MGLLKKFIDNCIRDTVTPVQGSVVCCDLALVFEHSGIYIGNNKIVHLDGSGIIESVSPRQFMERLDGLNFAISIYVSSNNGCSIGSAKVAERAKSMIGRSRDYNFILDNCHQFTAGCLTGDFENSNNFLWLLKDEALKYIDADEWRAWTSREYGEFAT